MTGNEPRISRDQLARAPKYAVIAACLASHFLLSHTAVAEEVDYGIQLYGEFAERSCDDYSYTTASLTMVYQPTYAHEPGSKVFMIYGWERSAERGGFTDWNDVNWKQLRYDEEKKQYSLRILKVLHEHSKPNHFVEGLNFALLMKQPDGTDLWDKGTPTPQGFFRTNWRSFNMSCIDSPETKVPIIDLNVQAVRKG